MLTSSIKQTLTGGLLGILLLVSGCAQSQKMVQKHPLLETPLGPTLEKMWKAHGSWEKWESFNRAQLKFRTFGDPPFIRSPEWQLSFNPHHWTSMEMDGELITLQEIPQHSVESQLMDFQVKSARIFHQLPFILGEQGWEYRLDVFSEEGGEAPTNFWVLPQKDQPLHIGYFVMLDPATFLIDRIYYQSSHSHHHRRMLVVDFKDYQPIDGLMIPMLSIHRSISQRPDPKKYPKGLPYDPFEDHRLKGGSQSSPEPEKEVLSWSIEILEMKFWWEEKKEPEEQLAEDKIAQNGLKSIQDS